MKYATFDSVTRRLNARYDSNIHSVIPAGAVALTDDLFFRTINETDGVWALVNGSVVKTALPGPTLSDAKTDQISALTASYNTAIQQPVAYMSTTFQADLDSQTKVMAVLAAMTPAGSTPAGFYWVDEANAHIPMTLAQVQGLAQAMMAQGWTAFQNLQTRKASVNAAVTIPDVQAVVW